MASGARKVVVVGAGNAASCAALAAREAGAEVVMLESAPQEDCGGNSRYAAGSMRITFDGVDDLAQVIDLTDEEKSLHDFGRYTRESYFEDMARITQYQGDPELCEVLISNSFDTARWLSGKGVRFQASYGNQSHPIDGKRRKFWGGLAVEAWGGGPGLVEAEHKACAREGIEIRYDTPVTGLVIDDDGSVTGVKVRSNGRMEAVAADAVVLACGGFESSAEMRARYLGPGWDLAKVRGTRYNTGAGLQMALAAGAMPYGHWSGCHAVGWDQNAPPFGDLAVGDQYQKHGYPWGIMVNANGRRFLDEGADFRNFTYARYGRRILEQPGMFAWQIFDNKMIPTLRSEYRIKQVTKVRADTLEALVAKLEGVDAKACLDEILAYNRAVRTDIPLNMAVRDGRRTEGLPVDKTNWADTIDQPPFEAYAVTCGITFSFGGVKVSTSAEVEDTTGHAIPGLFAAGEMVGGIFFHNYPGGTGLASGAVFGRIAGASAGRYVQRVSPR